MSSQALVIESKGFLPLEIGYLTESTINKCEEELNETPERKIKGLQELRSLLQSDSKSSGIDFFEDVLVSFLRRNKYRVEDAKKQILHFIHLHRTESMLGEVPDEYLDLPSSNFLVLLPWRCQDGCAILLLRYSKWDPTELPLEQLKKILVMVICQAVRDPMTQINGFKAIHDLEGVSFKQIKYCTPTNLLLFYHGTVNCTPARYKEINIISESSLLSFVWRLVKPIMSEKMRSRVRFHKNKEELFHHFPRRIMPTDYGGEVPEADMKDWIRRSNKEQRQFSMRGQTNYY